MGHVTIHWDAAGWAQLAGEVDAGTANAAGKVRDEAKAIITREDRVDTGALRNSITAWQVTFGTKGAKWYVGSDLSYAPLQHEGVEGPILPRRAKVLRFKPKGSTTFIFRPRSSGFEGIHFLTRALDTLEPRDFRW